ncbi:hypothetical protein [Pseudomonas sp. Gutcm_11s]|uniref:hypothetical protein n=1 Tax=Pseudomonas sp. Gutcm_11s TaxID=3026088 RepID=UPI00235DFAE7|nr:hypothetical protein [Pseudomonas sp. Gutcm_11s]MDD0844628.1 hypothetical protein [Pseudomonas sp. Gutcm_11s]
MNDERFRSGLNIAGYCLTLANEDLQDLSTHPCSPATTARLLQLHESIENCVMIIESLKHYLATPHPVPSSVRPHIPHCL